MPENGVVHRWCCEQEPHRDGDVAGQKKGVAHRHGDWLSGVWVDGTVHDVPSVSELFNLGCSKLDMIVTGLRELLGLPCFLFVNFFYLIQDLAIGFECVSWV